MQTHALTAMAAVLALAACNRSEPAANENQVVASNDLTNETAGTSAQTVAIDSAFLTDAIKGDNDEVALGQLAQSQGHSQAVKDFGKLLASDHGAHKQELAALAQTAGLAVTDEATDEGKAGQDKLKALHGAEFDKQFKTMMVDGHTKTIAKYEIQASTGDAQTAAIAQKTLPTLRKHLDAANAL